jgi:hypothetical protein
MQCRTGLIPGLFLVILSVVLVSSTGCSGAGAMSQIEPQPTPSPQPSAVPPPTITSQPTGQAVRVGQTASFSVTATGTGPVSYQWSKNGTAISGAMQSSYTTPPTVAADNLSTFAVTVSNSGGSVTSNSATLVLNPPGAGDLRFQQVDSASVLAGYSGFEFTNILGNTGLSWGNYGSPFMFTPLAECVANVQSDCAWFFSLFNTSGTGLKTSYQSGILSNLQSDLDSMAPNTVITSIDLQPESNAYARSWAESSQTAGFNLVTQSIQPSDLQTVATSEGSLGRVVTAVSFNAGLIFVVSYGWQSDPTTVYEAQVATATLDTMLAQAEDLAQQGFILTAIGGNPSDGYLLVGTRVAGDTMPRPLKAVVSPGQDVASELWSQGYAIVGFITNANNTAVTWIGEK